MEFVTSKFDAGGEETMHGGFALLEYSWRLIDDGVDNGDWLIRGVLCGIGRFKADPHVYYIISLFEDDFPIFPNIGPFETFQAAAVAATLMGEP
jgi:hypothetical protein